MHRLATAFLRTGMSSVEPACPAGGPATVPAVTVLIPAYNGGPLLRKAVDSILVQTFTDFECLVIDDGSTDGAVDALAAVRDPRLRIVRNPRNLGLISTLNRGLELARAPLVARMDADDISLPRRLEVQVGAFASDAQLAIVGSWAQYIDQWGATGPLLRSPLSYDDILAHCLLSSPFIHPTVMFRVDAVRKIGGYPCNAHHAEDYALWLEVVAKHLCINLPEVLLHYRIHSAQISQTKMTDMYNQTQRLRHVARERFRDAGLHVCEREPISASMWARVRGKPGTLGAVYASWAMCYRQLGQLQPALKTAIAGLRSSPLSGRLWLALVPFSLHPTALRARLFRLRKR